MQRIVIAGDSITQLGGLPVTPQGCTGWGHQVVAAMLAAGTEAQLFGCGQGGDTAAILTSRWGQTVEPYAKPGAWLTIGVGTNDCLHATNGVPPEEFATQLADLVNRAEAEGYQVTLLTPPRLEVGATLTLAHNEGLYPYVKAVRSLAAERPTVLLADLNAACLRSAAGPLTYDGAHPNAAGHQLIAATILQAWGIGGVA